MTLTQLRYIVALDRHKSFARAAESCLVAQPTLSLQIQKLEQEIGAEIFDRNKNPVITTKFGTDIVDQAKIILREADRLEEIFRESKEDLTGKISIGIIPTISAYLLPQIFKKLNKDYASIDFRFFELPTSQIIEKLMSEDLEIGILATPLHRNDIIESPLYYEPFVAYYPKDYEGKTENIDIDDLKSSEMILLGEEHCLRHQSLKICGQRTLGKIECGSLETIRNMVDLGVGMTLLPLLSMNAENDKFGRFKDPEPVREVSLVYKHGFYKKKILQAVQKTILSVIPKELQDKGNRKLIGI
ncbi:LysR substrate-binding domain-containing protein [Leptospira sp. GIMC2001]|uniref:LysR substrate-binding domain-containing protein n=1 Tax=Leptospira sp. GIMC2001 TaxID=1513297 RepID=UPI00234A49BB|nr:LysR substrate-binding domain-containing protein [Leptospira sp. GIMC2001]WCL48626.1 LysR substrate-binding domain-containing protein [Leptospira sp. GIMC2001]